MLVKEAGFDLEAIRGRTEHSVSIRDQQGLIPRLRRNIPFLADPEPIVEREKTEQKGMSNEEVMRFLIYHDEIEEIKKEENEEEMREARRRQGQIGDTSGQQFTGTTGTGSFSGGNNF